MVSSSTSPPPKRITGIGVIRGSSAAFSLVVSDGRTTSFVIGWEFARRFPPQLPSRTLPGTLLFAWCLLSSSFDSLDNPLLPPPIRVTIPGRCLCPWESLYGVWCGASVSPRPPLESCRKGIWGLVWLDTPLGGVAELPRLPPLHGI